MTEVKVADSSTGSEVTDTAMSVQKPQCSTSPEGNSEDSNKSSSSSTTCDSQCSVCQERLSSAKSQWIHRWLHEKKTFHVCQICHTKFEEFTDLKKHEKGHFGETLQQQKTLSSHVDFSLNSSLVRAMSDVARDNCTKAGSIDSSNVSETGNVSILEHSSSLASSDLNTAKEGNNIHTQEYQLQIKAEDDDECSDDCLIIECIDPPQDKEKKTVKCLTGSSVKERRTEPCNKCDMLFTNPRLLQEHLLEVHQEKMYYPCVQCGRIFLSPSTLRSHVKSDHKAVPSPASSTNNQCFLESNNYEKKSLDHKWLASKSLFPDLMNLDDQSLQYRGAVRPSHEVIISPALSSINSAVGAGNSRAHTSKVVPIVSGERVAHILGNSINSTTSYALPSKGGSFEARHSARGRNPPQLPTGSCPPVQKESSHLKDFKYVNNNGDYSHHPLDNQQEWYVKKNNVAGAHSNEIRIMAGASNNTKKRKLSMDGASRSQSLRLHLDVQKNQWKLPEAGNQIPIRSHDGRRFVGIARKQEDIHVATHPINYSFPTQTGYHPLQYYHPSVSDEIDPLGDRMSLGLPTQPYYSQQNVQQVPIHTFPQRQSNYYSYPYLPNYDDSIYSKELWNTNQAWAVGSGCPTSSFCFQPQPYPSSYKGLCETSKCSCPQPPGFITNAREVNVFHPPQQMPTHSRLDPQLHQRLASNSQTASFGHYDCGPCGQFLRKQMDSTSLPGRNNNLDQYPLNNPVKESRVIIPSSAPLPRQRLNPTQRMKKTANAPVAQDTLTRHHYLSQLTTEKKQLFHPTITVSNNSQQHYQHHPSSILKVNVDRTKNLGSNSISKTGHPGRREISTSDNMLLPNNVHKDNEIVVSVTDVSKVRIEGTSEIKTVFPAPKTPEKNCSPPHVSPLTHEISSSSSAALPSNDQEKEAADPGLVAKCPLPEEKSNLTPSYPCLICHSLFLSEIDAKLHEVCMHDEIVDTKSNTVLPCSPSSSFESGDKGSIPNIQVETEVIISTADVSQDEVTTTTPDQFLPEGPISSLGDNREQEVTK